MATADNHHKTTEISLRQTGQFRENYSVISCEEVHRQCGVGGGGGFFLACEILGECSTIHSPPAFFFFFLKWR